MTFSSWLAFGRPAPLGRGSVVGQKILARPYYSQRTVFASPLSAFFPVQFEIKACIHVLLMAGNQHTGLQGTTQDVRRHPGNEPGTRKSRIPTANGVYSHLLIITWSSQFKPTCGVFQFCDICDIFRSVLWHCWLGDRKGIWPVKKTGCWFVGGDDLTGALHDL